MSKAPRRPDAHDDSSQYVSGTFFDDTSATEVIDAKAVAEESAASKSDRHEGAHAPQHMKDDTTSKKRKKRRRRGPGFVITIVVIVVAMAYFGVCIYYQDHLLPNTVIDTVDCSNMKVADAKGAVKDYLDTYRLDVNGRESSETIQGSSIGMSYFDDDSIDQILAAQNRFSWPARLFGTGQDEVCSMSYDVEAATAAIGELSCMDPRNMRAPSDIRPAFDGTEYHLVAADYGTTLDTDRARSSALDAIARAKSSVDLDATGSYIDPAVTMATPELEQKVDYFNKYLRFSITYTIGNQQQVLDGNVAQDWLVFDSGSEGSCHLDKDKVEEYVTQMEDAYDTVGTERTFVSQDGSEVTVSGGTYGWKIDHDAEVDAILDAFDNHTCETREPTWEQTAVSHDAVDWGDTYMEVSIADQHWWAVKDGQVVLESDCVTGLPTPKRVTPTGVYDILDKQSPYTMHGDQHEDGSYAYVTKCKYWMRVTWSGVGFHDAPWQPYFGGSRYRSGGSHGCINTPSQAAAELYDIIEVGWPVIIHD